MSHSSADEVRVLHVDDEPDLADTSAAFVERENERLTVETAADAAEGLERLSAGEFDCVVSDYDMPGRNGIEFLEAVREKFPDLPFILFTGKGSEEVASDAISAGVTDYLQKEAGTDQYAILANRVVNAVERARAEQAQRRHLRAIETAQEGISILDKDGKYVYVNQAYADIYGYEPGEMLGADFALTYPEGELEAVQADVMPAVDETGFWRGETTGLRADGSTFVEEHTLATTEEGELVCSVWDKTERKERERAIEELHSTVRAFMEAETTDEVAEIAVSAVHDVLDMPAAAVHRYDPEGDCLRPAAFTDASERLIGDAPTFHRGEGLAWAAFESGETEVYDDVAAEPGRYNSDTAVRSEMLLPLGEHGILLVGSPEPAAFDETSVSLARMLAAHATTALDGIESERTLREEREFVDQALETLNDVFYVLGPDGELRRWNDRLREVFGYDDDALADMRLQEFFPEEDHDRITRAFEATLETGQSTLEADVVTADGDRVPYEFTAAPLTGDDGEVTGIVGIGRNVSERREHERQLRRQNERLSEFASVVSHDLRNPLNVARARLDLARREDEDKHFEAVSRAHERMETLIDDLLAFARDGERATNVADVDLASTVADCWRTVETGDATLVTETERTVRADRSKLHQLLENCIRNAVEHGGAGVTVTVGDLPDGFYVADDGVGVPEGAWDDVFEAGYSRSAGGTGLGLNIVEQVADAHGWEITVRESDDGGARFEVSGVETAA